MTYETKCFECDHGTLVPGIVDLIGHRNGEEFTVRAPGLQCTECGFKTIDNEKSGEFTKAVSDAYRTAHGLLTGTEIRDRRRRLEMSQLAFARHLGVGVASVKRWERGLIQEKAMDELIRLKTDLSAARRNLRALELKIAVEYVLTTAVFGDDNLELSIRADQSFSPRTNICMDRSYLDRWSSTQCVKDLAVA